MSTAGTARRYQGNEAPLDPPRVAWLDGRYTGSMTELNDLLVSRSWAASPKPLAVLFPPVESSTARDGDEPYVNLRVQEAEAAAEAAHERLVENYRARLYWLRDADDAVSSIVNARPPMRPKVRLPGPPPKRGRYWSPRYPWSKAILHYARRQRHALTSARDWRTFGRRLTA